MMFLFLSGGRYSTTSAFSQRSSWVKQRSTIIKLYATTITETNNHTTSRTKNSFNKLPSIVLKRNRRTKIFRDGSQLVFSGSIDKIPKSLSIGDLVQIEVPPDTKNNDGDQKSNSSPQQQQQQQPNTIIGWGVYNPESMYRVRILCHSLLHPEMIEVTTSMEEGNKEEEENKILQQILKMNFRRSLLTRKAIGLPSSNTDTFRLVNSEGDSISGLAVDVIGDKVAVIMSSAAWCQIHKDTIVQSLQEILPGYDLIWKTTASRLKQDGYTLLDDEDDNIVEKTGSEDPLICLENGIKYQTFPYQKGQKTSVYCDQRENRQTLAQLSSGKKVLDLCCYHGGFSLNAAKHGAELVVGVDSSQDAIETCESNVALNEFDTDMISFIKSDISNFMKECDQKFDLVVLDPPKLAPSANALPRATRKYHSLNRDAIKLISDDGGLLMTCTCSAAMTQKDGGKYFLETVQQASLSANREITLLKVSGAAPCHTQSPYSFPAGNYLTAALFMVHPKTL